MHQELDVRLSEFVRIALSLDVIGRFTGFSLHHALQMTVHMIRGDIVISTHRLLMPYTSNPDRGVLDDAPATTPPGSLS